jgi:hypothetical protein
MGARAAVALLLTGLILVPAAGGSGPPDRRVRDGVSASSWRLRPGTLVTPERRVFRILVTENACAGGRPATGRVEEPLVVREEGRVQVAMFVRPLDGPATCPTNPPTPYTLRLDDPLGDRTLADGGTIPPRPVRGRLTRRGYQRAIARIVSDTAEPTRLFTALVVRRRAVAGCSRLMWNFTGQVGGLLGRVARLDPPPAAAAVQREFLHAAWRSWRRLESIGGAVAAGRVRCGQELNDRIYGMPSTDRAERAIARLERLGYRVFGE